MSGSETQPAALPVPSVAAQDDIATVVIGLDKKVFKVHKALLCYHSEYFRIACNGKWKEAVDGITIEDVEPEVFSIFVYWLYKQRLPPYHKDFLEIAAAHPLEFPESSRSQELYLVKACVFGDRFFAPGFKRSAHNLYVKLMAAGAPWYEQVRHAFENLPENDLLLKLMVEKQCVDWRPEFDKGNPEDAAFLKLIPSEFLIMVMTRNYELNHGPRAGREVKEFDIYPFQIPNNDEDTEHDE